jgi:hypothetical protein
MQCHESPRSAVQRTPNFLIAPVKIVPGGIAVFWVFFGSLCTKDTHCNLRLNPRLFSSRGDSGRSTGINKLLHHSNPWVAYRTQNTSVKLLALLRRTRSRSSFEHRSPFPDNVAHLGCFDIYIPASILFRCLCNCSTNAYQRNASLLGI